MEAQPIGHSHEDGLICSACRPTGSAPKVQDALTPLGRKVLNEVQARDKNPGEPGWIAPGGEYMLSNPVEDGWEPVKPEEPKRRVDWEYLRALGSVPGNVFIGDLPSEETTTGGW